MRWEICHFAEFHCTLKARKSHRWPTQQVTQAHTLVIEIKLKVITVKDASPLIPLKILPLAWNILIPWFLTLSEAVLEGLFREHLYMV